MFTPSIKTNSHTALIQPQRVSFGNANASLRTNKLAEDQFVSFRGKFDRVTLPKIEVLEDVSEEFEEKVKTHLRTCPKSILDNLRHNGTKIILSPPLDEAYTPDETIGITHKPLKRTYIILGDNPWYYKYLEKDINCELGHAFVKANDLVNNEEIKAAIKKDFDEAEKENKYLELSEAEEDLVGHYFLEPNDYYSPEEIREEIISDLIAWQCPKGGNYGGGEVFKVDNPDLMPYLFPNLKEVLEKRFFS